MHIYTYNAYMDVRGIHSDLWVLLLTCSILSRAVLKESMLSRELLSTAPILDQMKAKREKEYVFHSCSVMVCWLYDVYNRVWYIEQWLNEAKSMIKIQLQKTVGWWKNKKKFLSKRAVQEVKRFVALK